MWRCIMGSFKTMARMLVMNKTLDEALFWFTAAVQLVLYFIVWLGAPTAVAWWMLS